MKNKQERFWLIIKANWTLEERIDMRAACEAWMSAEVKK